MDSSRQKRDGDLSRKQCDKRSMSGSGILTRRKKTQEDDD
jgi:hypothetical protein